MTIKLNSTLRNARLQVLSDAIDAGSAVMRIYSGVKPSNLAAVTTQVKLCELAFPLPSANEITAGILSFNPIAEAMVLVSGVATWARIVADDATVIADLDVGNTASSAELRLPDTQLYQGVILRFPNWFVSES